MSDAPVQLPQLAELLTSLGSIASHLEVYLFVTHEIVRPTS